MKYIDRGYRNKDIEWETMWERNTYKKINKEKYWYMKNEIYW